jgi:hypothetical protein
MAKLLLLANRVAVREGKYPSCSATCLTFFLISSLMRGESLSARDTVDSDTPAALATSSLPTLFVMFASVPFVLSLWYEFLGNKEN